jgi:hypothetical protein
MSTARLALSTWEVYLWLIVAKYEQNDLAIQDMGLYSPHCFGPEYHIPRGSLPLWNGRDQPECTPVPGEYICHTPLPPTSNSIPSLCTSDPSGEGLDHCDWEDSVYQIAQQFGVDWKALCAFNGMKNCSAISYIGSSLKIPVSAP